MHKGGPGGAGWAVGGWSWAYELVVITVLDTHRFAVGQLQPDCNGFKKRQGLGRGGCGHRVGGATPHWRYESEVVSRREQGEEGWVWSSHPPPNLKPTSQVTPPARLGVSNPGHTVGVAHGDKIGWYRIGATRVGDTGRFCNAAGVRHCGVKMGFRGV